MNHFEFIQPPKSNACDLNLDQRLFLSVIPASFNHLFVCLHTADARTNRSEWCRLRGGQSSKGSREMQGRERTPDLTHWGRGGGRRFSLIIASLFLPHFLTFVFLSAIPTNSECFPLSAVSCAAGMQASQATILAVRLQPSVHMTQFQHTNINRAGIFHQTTGSPVQVLHFRPAYSPICRQQSVSHFSFHSVAAFFSTSEDGLTFSLIWEGSSDRHYQSGRPKKAPL